MKEAIEDLIATYKKRVDYLRVMIRESKDNLAIIRYQSKKSTYYQTIRELEMLLKDEQDKT